jgi:hypothetical protein
MPRSIKIVLLYLSLDLSNSLVSVTSFVLSVGASSGSISQMSN